MRGPNFFYAVKPELEVKEINKPKLESNGREGMHRILIISHNCLYKKINYSAPNKKEREKEKRIEEEDER